MTDDKARLACFDDTYKKEEAAAKLKDVPIDKPSTQASTEATKPADASNDAKPPSVAPPLKVDGIDLAVAPDKYLGKFVEVAPAQCFYADQDTYRCILSVSPIAVLQATAITPDTEREAIERDCNAIRNMPKLQCRRTLRFIAERSDADAVSTQDRITILTSSVEMIRGSPQSRKRRR